MKMLDFFKRQEGKSFEGYMACFSIKNKVGVTDAAQQCLLPKPGDPSSSTRTCLVEREADS